MHEINGLTFTETARGYLAVAAENRRHIQQKWYARFIEANRSKSQ